MTTHNSAQQHSAQGSASNSAPDAAPREVHGGGADLEAVAVAALTEIARRAQPDRDGRARGPDAAEVIAAMVTTAAANVGGLEVLLAGRPGSWEAAAVRELVHGTVGEDEVGLWRLRTEPVRLVLDVEDEFSRLGLTALYLDDRDIADTALIAMAERDVAGRDELDDVVGEAAVRAAEDLFVAVDRLFDDDLVAYRAAYGEVVAAELARLGRPDLPVEIVSPAGAAESSLELAVGWSPLIEGFHLVSGERTPLPATGQPPDWTSGSPADAVRAAGRGYLDRARALVAADTITGGATAADDNAADDATVGETTGDDTADGDAASGGDVTGGDTRGGTLSGSVAASGGAW